MAAAKESIPATGPSIPNIRKFKGKFSISENKSELRVVETQAILFLKSMTERGGSEIERL